MRKNKVQFQKGLSLPDFLSRYGSEAQCEAALFAWRWPGGFRCEGCGHGKFCTLSPGRRYQCNGCHHQTRLTAGTMFHSTKLPLAKWFLAMYLMTQSKNGISQLELGRQVGVSPNTAAMMYHKIAQTMMERDMGKPLSGDIEADDAWWGGVRVGAGQNRYHKTPFIAAVEKRDGRPNRIKLSVVSRFSKSAVKRWAETNLTADTRVLTDGLPCFSGIAQAGRHHERKVVGDPRIPANAAPFHWVNTLLGNIKTALRGTFHKLGPQYLRRHLAAFAYRFNRRYALETMIARFGFIAVRTPPLPKRVLSVAAYHG